LERFDEAMQVDARKKWEQAMDEEHKALMENQTWDLVKLPEGKKSITKISGCSELKRKKE
ncbi:hypothetical protein KI387_042125, partial [Taxus chinensis]